MSGDFDDLAAGAINSAVEFDGWRKLLNREPVTLHPNPEDALSGYYKARDGRDGPFVPVAIWREGDQVRAEKNGKMVSVERVWPYVAKRPISYEVFTSVIETGSWPEDHPMVEAQSKSNNVPDDNSFEAFKGNVDELVIEARKLLKKGAPDNQGDASKIASLADRLLELTKKGPALRDTDPDISPEMRATQAKVVALTGRWKPVIDAAFIYRMLKEELLTPFLLKKQQEENARAAQDDDGQAPAPRAVVRTGKGKAVGLRSKQTIEFSDFKKTLLHFKGNEKIVDLVETLAKAEFKSTGKAPPGVKIKTSQSA